MIHTIKSLVSAVINYSWICTSILLFSLVATKVYAETPSKLTFLTWEDYIDQDVVTAFEQAYNAEIKFVYFESDDGRDEILTTYGPSGYDLILVDSVAMPFYHNLNWITELDKNRAPNLKNLALPELAGLNHRDKLCAPYTWGTTGIVYRKDLVPTPITHWKQLFEPSPELNNKILMPVVANELVGIALKYLGYSMASGDQQQLEQARHVLLTQAPMVAGYSAVVGNPEQSKLVSGEISAAITYSGDALMLQEIEPLIEYVLPAEGGAIWADFVCISGDSKNIELAYQFLDFINQPKQAAANALYFYGASPNIEAQKLLPEEFLNNPIIYPSKKTISNSELYQPLAPSILKAQNSILNELMQLHDRQD